MGMFAMIMVSLVVCLESLHEQSSNTLVLPDIVAPGMCKDLVIFEPLS